MSFYTAARDGQVDLLRYHLQHGADVHVRFNSDRTALHFACDGGNAEVVQILLAAQADVNIPDMFNKDTPLHLACEAGHVDVVRILLENRGHVNAQDQMNGETPLHLACEAGHSDIVQLLLEYGADASIENVYRKRALHYADSSTLEVMQSRDQGGRGGDISDGSIARDDVGYDATLSLESKSPPERLPGGLELEEPRGRAEELTCDGKEEMNLINNVLSGGLKVAESVDEEVEDDDLITALEDEGPTRALEASEGDSWYAVHSMAGRASDGRDKQNQDAFIISTQLGGDPNMALFGVFDGHGRNGHLVAYFAKSVLPGIISRDIASLRSAARDEQGSLQDEGASQRRLASLSSGIVANILSAAFTTLQQMLEEQEKFDCQSSGSTALLALVAYGTLYTANVGDSRAIVARLSSHDSSRERDGDREQLTVVPMSEDQVPNVSEERRRIEQQGGLVRRDQDPLTGEQGPFRVWRRDLAGPGLAMSRSIGDVSAHQIGVSALPVVMEYPLARQDRLLVLATDGVWDMLDNSEGIDIAARASGDGQGEPGFAARLVCETARRAWEFKETRIDDITCLLVFLPLVQDSPDVGLLPQTEAAEVAVDRFSVHVPAPHIGDYTVFNDEGLSQGARADGFHVAGDYGSRTGENVCHDGAILMRGLHSQPARAPYEPPHRTTHWEQGFQEQHEASSSRPFEASTRSVQLHVPPSFTQHAHQGHRSWDGDEEPPFMDGRHAPGHLPSHAPSFAERPSETPPWSAGLSSQSQQAPEKNQSFTQSAPQRPQQNRQQFDNEIWPKPQREEDCTIQ